MLAQRIERWRTEASGPIAPFDRIQLSLAGQCVIAAWLHADPSAIALLHSENPNAIEHSLNAFLGALCRLTTGSTPPNAETLTTNQIPRSEAPQTTHEKGVANERW